MAPSFLLSLLLNTVSLGCIVSVGYYALRFHRKPVLAWNVPLHLSYQDFSVAHSRGLAQYDPELWNRFVYIGGALVAGLILVAFQHQRHYQSRWTYVRQMRARLDQGDRFVSRKARGDAAHTKFRVGTATLIILVLAAYIGPEISSSLLGMHTVTWTVTSPIRQVSTSAISAELTFVPAATPWDIGSVMLRSAFEHVVSQKGPGALEITHRYLSRHLREGRVQIGTTVYPSIRTHGVGVAPVPWARQGYQVAPGHRVLRYDPIVAGTNVTVMCRNATEEWTWDYTLTEVPVGIGQQLEVHHFDVGPRSSWNTPGPNHTATYVEGNTRFNLETWLATWKSDDGQVMQARQVFVFTNVPPIAPRVPTVSVIECTYGGVDIVRQVYMTSPIDPIAFGDELAVKDAISYEDLWPAANAIEEALGRDGGMMLAGMRAGLFTSLEVWDHYLGRTLQLTELIENVLVDTAQAYFSLVRQWREEAQFFSWPSEFPKGQLTTMTRRLGGKGLSGTGHLIMLGLLAILPLAALTQLLLSGFSDWQTMRRRDFSERFELKDGVIRKKSD